MQRTTCGLVAVVAMGFVGCGEGRQERVAESPPALVAIEGGFVAHGFPVYRGRTFAFAGLVVRSQRGAPVTLLDARPVRPSAPLR